MSNNEQKKISYLSALAQLGKFAWGIFIGISIVVTVATMVTDFKVTKEHPILTGLAILAVTIFVSLILLIDKMIKSSNELSEKNTELSKRNAELLIQVETLTKNGRTDKNPLNLASELVNIVNSLYEEEKYLDVVRFGSTISRYLWINGHNKERIAIGEHVEDAASKEDRVEEQVSALIDDIGWTYHIVDENAKAIINISNGVDKAVENSLFYLAAKGERHLSGITKHQGKISEFKKHLENAETYTSKILDTSDKNEMEASLHLARAKYAYETDQLDEAEKSAKQAMDIFKNDLDRIVKVHQLLGNIYVKQNKIQKAKDEFNKGYESCKGIRKDEFAKNAIGLAKIALSEGDVRSYTKYLNEARAVYVAHHKNKEVNEIDSMLKSIKT